MEELKNGNVSASSSPPTPPSPLPISVGPGNQKYLFSASPTPSPPFSPPSSSHASAENLPLLHDNPRSTPAQVGMVGAKMLQLLLLIVHVLFIHGYRNSESIP
ncbi:hypothetical protein CRYUN_Cryun31cG0118600 [Craigia yunnanensis]